MQNSDYISNSSGWKYFFLLTIFSVLIVFAFNFIFLTDGIYYQSFGDHLALERIGKIIELSRKLQWVSYILIPIMVLIRVGFTTSCLYIGCFFTEIRIHFSKLFRIALLADFVFVLAGIIKLVILIFFINVNTLSDLQFQPLSLMQLFDRSSVEPYFIYPLSLIVWLTYFGYYYNIILLFLVTLFWLLIGWLTYFGCTHLFCADSIGSKKIERRGGGILRWRWWSSGIRGSLDRSGSAPAVAAATASASILAL